MPRIELSGVTRAFDTVANSVALDHIDLQISPGEFVAIEGPSGSGKSTLLNILGLIDPITAGRYVLAGQETSSLPRDAATRLRSDHCAFIFQGFHLLDDRPVRDSVELALLYRGITSQERRRRAQEALSVVGLAEFADRPARLLSGGERQRVAIARALASDAPIVLADEPTGNLDSTTGRLIVDELAGLHARGATVILVTHDPDVARRAQRRIRLMDGRIVSDTGPAAVASHRDSSPPGHAAQLRRRHLLADAVSSLCSRRARSSMLAAAIALGVGLGLATLGISQTAQAQVSDAFDSRLNVEVSVRWFPSSPSGAEEPRLNVDNLVHDVRALPGVKAAAVTVDLGGRHIMASVVREPSTARLVVAHGDVIDAYRLRVRWANQDSVAPGTDQLILGSALAHRLELGPLASQPAVIIDGMTMRVVGIIEESSREPELLSSAVSFDDSLWDQHSPHVVETAILTQPGAAPVVAQQAPWVINPFAPETLEVHAPIDPQDLRNEVEGSVVVTMAIVSLVALLAAVGAVANAMMLSISERRYEIGLRRALGATPRHVAALVGTEAAIVGAVGGVAGLALGLGSTLTVTAINGWLPTIDLRLVPLTVIGGVVVGILSGLVPAVRAARVSPQDALRH